MRALRRAMQSKMASGKNGFWQRAALRWPQLTWVPALSSFSVARSNHKALNS